MINEVIYTISEPYIRYYRCFRGNLSTLWVTDSLFPPCTTADVLTCVCFSLIAVFKVLVKEDFPEDILPINSMLMRLQFIGTDLHTDKISSRSIVCP